MNSGTAKTERKPYCQCCGEPCPKCVGVVDDYTLSILQEPVRDMVKELLSDIGSTKENLDTLVKGLHMYSPMVISRALAKWRAGGYAKKGINNPRYFIKIARACATAPKQKMEKLPPMIG